jgi:hypothetical protein
VDEAGKYIIREVETLKSYQTRAHGQHEISSFVYLLNAVSILTVSMNNVSHMTGDGSR